MSKVLEFSQLILPGSAANGLSRRYKKQLLMLTNMMRDMDLFRKLLLYPSRSQKTGHEGLDQAILVTLVFSFMKILVSKVFEIWQFFEKEHIEAEKAAFSPELLLHWEQIVAFFDDSKNRDLFHFVRNKFGFHFDHYPELEHYIEDAMNKIGDLEVWMCNDVSGNDLFTFSNTVMLNVLCKKMTELGFVGTQEELIGQLQKLPIEISHQMNEFCKRYFTEVLMKNIQFEERVRVRVDVPLLADVNLPLMVAGD